MDRTPSPESVSTVIDEHGRITRARSVVSAFDAARPVPPALRRAFAERGYDLLRCLGQGAFGVVYLAHQRSVDRLVAIKTIREDRATPALIDRLEAEARKLGKLSHPRIAGIHDAGTVRIGEAIQPFIIMEYVRGVSLDECVESASPLTLVTLLWRVCEAVAHAHKSGLTHRDLKPDNLLVEPGGADGAGQPKILDFGLARILDESAPGARLDEQPGQFIGTPCYASPEQAQRRPHETDARSDVYSLAVIGYELLTGTLPYPETAQTAEAWCRGIIEWEPVPFTQRFVPRHGRRALPFLGDLDAIFGKALAKRRDDRYRSAGDLAAALRRYLAHEPVQEDAGLPYRFRKLVRRNRGLTATSILAGAFVVAGSVALLDAARSGRAVGVITDEMGDVEYAGRLEEAQRLLAAGDARGARTVLRHCDEDRRGWEWSWLYSRVDRSASSFPIEQRDVIGVHLGARQAALLEHGAAGVIEIVDLAAGDTLRSIATGDDRVKAAALARGGDMIATGGRSGQLSIRRIDDGALLARREHEGRPVKFVQFASDDSILIAVRGDAVGLGRDEVIVWRWRTEEEPLLVGLEAPASAIAVAPDGSRVAAVGWDRRIRWVDLASGRVVTSDVVASETLRCLAWLPDATHLVYGGGDGSIQLWSEGSGAPHRIGGHEHTIQSLAVSADGALVASGDSFGEIRLWSASETLGAARSPMRLVAVLPGHDRSVLELAFGADGRSVVSRSVATVRTWRVPPEPEAIDWETESLPVAFAYDPSGRGGILVATAPPDATVVRHDLRSGVTSRPLLRPPQQVTGLAASGDGHIVAVGDRQGQLRIIGNGSSDDPAIQVYEPDGSASPSGLPESLSGGGTGLRVAVAPDGQVVVTGAPSGRVTVWAVESRAPVRELGGHGGAIRALAFDSSGRWLGSADSTTVRIWDMHTWALVREAAMTAPTGIVSLAMSPDGAQAVCGMKDGSLCLIGGHRDRVVERVPGHAGQVMSIGFSRDGRRFVTCGLDQTVRVWEGRGRQLLLTLPKWTASAMAFVSFAEADRVVVAGSLTKRCRVWTARAAPARRSASDISPPQAPADQGAAERGASGNEGGTATPPGSGAGPPVLSTGSP